MRIIQFLVIFTLATLVATVIDLLTGMGDVVRHASTFQRITHTATWTGTGAILAIIGMLLQNWKI